MQNNELSTSLLDWYDREHRDLAFRQDKEPYKIWISEIMAQQTRIEAMIGHYTSFIQKFPDIQSLANASQEELKKAWQGLGYYSRANNLQKAAQICIEQYDGKLPETAKELIQLPGIGPYTAGAIASICYDEKTAAIDGNVLRVFCRLYNIREDSTKPKTKKAIQALVLENMPDRAGDYNQAIMELGALVCIPQDPKCPLCPLKAYCQSPDPQNLPFKPAKKPRLRETKYFLLATDGEKIKLYQRPETGLLAGMWGFEEASPVTIEKMEREGRLVTAVPDHIHIFSHVEWHMHAWIWKVCADDTFITIEDAENKYPIPSAFQPFFQHLKDYIRKGTV